MVPEEPVIPPEEFETPLGIGFARVFAVAFLFAAAIFAAVYLMPQRRRRLGERRSGARGEALGPLRDHGTRRFPTGDLVQPPIRNPGHEVQFGAGLWGAEFHDLATETKSQYVAEEDTLYRLPESEDLSTNPAHDLEFFHYFREGGSFKGSVYPNTEIARHREHEVVQAGEDLED